MSKAGSKLHNVMEIENESISMGSTVRFNECNSDPALPPTDKLPISGLLALATAAFIALLTEVMPAGLLSSIASGLHVSDSFAGQFITAYAAGAFLAAIPVTSLTQGVRRRSLLLVTIAGFAAVNAATALSSHTFSLSLPAFSRACSADSCGHSWPDMLRACHRRI
ncbi:MULTISPECIES: hypothetical protein [unclassified Novosphingobium]|uniref:hypothetical protein n=1 Tax=unclassified Novosphingobium TaxID=2644732 RepID=UPI0018568982|nr:MULTISPECIES: hypothetical protein [unclassified Novosphingobium]MBB3356983.1 putative MFS family arabinose efflux permease [Novosphingobium sp. BK256]MBB3373384.1 putative MFS family arabinose efflux permease [Novosphingobium sp. BK280]MBB3377753.1 putative MFS family arabinose efflux permease [Novosphingobium sp. BK258]MBB3418836.1 putative MFS family arabinose efflux permease [Novosphingobium sp. BK267]MBB3450329.1 putative MFS family arabinose efflux permease [Novosphingobium sp. BK352]